MKIIHYIILAVVIFFMLYFPPIININPLYILFIISVFYLIEISIIKRKIKVSKFTIKILLVLIMLIILEIVVSSANNLFSLSAINDLLFMTCSFVIVSIAIRNYCIIHYVNNNELFAVLIGVGLIQAIFSLIAYLNTGFQSWFIQRMIDYGYEASRFSQIAQFRWFGVATQLGFATPVIQMVLALMCIKCGMDKSRKFYFAALLLIFSAIINARLSVFILLGGIMIIFFDKFRRKITKSEVIKIFAFLGFGIIVAAILLEFMKRYSYNNYNWMVGGLKSFLGIHTDLTGVYPVGGYFSEIEHYKLPDGLHIITGFGRHLHNTDLGFSTDIGFIIDIWKYGIIVSLILYVLIFCSFKRIKKIEDNDFSYMPMMMSFLFVICNLKGNIIFVTPISALYFFLICAFPLYESKEKTEY